MLLIRKDIQKILNDAADLCKTFEIIIPTNYSLLQTAVMQKEFKQEVEKLKSLFNKNLAEDQLKQQFKELCADRVSCTVNFESVCNKLYWDILEILFVPSTWQEVLAILMPKVKKILTIELTVASQTKKEILLTLEEKQLLPQKHDSLLTLEKSRFQELIIVNDIAFDLDELARLSFELQRKFYSQLRNYPEFKAQIYQHNNVLKQLLADIELYEQKGKRPREVLAELAKMFELSGEKYTGNSERAAIQGEIAWDAFRYYIKMLPAEFLEKLLKIKGITSSSLGEILNDLDDVTNLRCVEVTADKLRSILENSNNKTLLDTNPQITENEFAAIEQKYNKHGSLSVIGHSSLIILPENLSKTLLQQLIIENVYDYINLLLAIPHSEFELFLASVTIHCLPQLPSKLSTAFKNNYFNSEQKAAFFSAIEKHQNRFGGAETVFKFMLDSDYLQKLSQDKIVTLLEQDNNFNILLDWSNYHNDRLDILKHVIQSISITQRLSFLQQKPRFLTVFSLVLNKKNKEIVLILLQELKEEQLITLLKPQEHYQALFLWSMQNNDGLHILKYIIQFISAEQWLSFLNQEYDLVTTVFSWALATKNKEILLAVVQGLKGEQLIILLEQRENFKTLLLGSEENNDVLDFLKYIIQSISIEQWLFFLKKQFFTICMGQNKKNILVILQELKGDQLMDLLKVPLNRIAVLNWSTVNNDGLDILKHIIQSISVKQQLYFLNQQYYKSTVFQWSLKNKNKAVVSVLLERLSGSQLVALQHIKVLLTAPELMDFIKNPRTLLELDTHFPEQALQRLYHELKLQHLAYFSNLTEASNSTKEQIIAILKSFLEPKKEVNLFQKYEYFNESSELLISLNNDTSQDIKIIVEQSFQGFITNILNSEKENDVVPANCSFIQALSYCYNLATQPVPTQTIQVQPTNEKTECTY